MNTTTITPEDVAETVAETTVAFLRETGLASFSGIPELRTFSAICPSCPTAHTHAVAVDVECEWSTDEDYDAYSLMDDLTVLITRTADGFCVEVFTLDDLTIGQVCSDHAEPATRRKHKQFLVRRGVRPYRRRPAAKASQGQRQQPAKQSRKKRQVTR